jgi:hypothetical protein
MLEYARAMPTVRVGDRDIEVKPGPRYVVEFDGGPNRGDAGRKEFWVLERAGKKSLIGRSPLGEDAGYKFRQVESDGPGLTKFGTLIRPATADEVRQWLDGHPEDSPHAVVCEFDGKQVAEVLWRPNPA